MKMNRIFPLVLFVLAPLLAGAATENKAFYQDSSWKPRAILPAEEALRGDFCPKSPQVTVTYDDPEFATDRLGKLPAPGVHPRVLITPDGVEKIRAKVELGAKAPVHFRTLWRRAAKSKSAFYALVAKDDALGRELAAQLVEKIKALKPKLDEMDRRPDKENLWVVERSIVASGDPNPPTEIWDLLDYDYLHGWMSPEERELARATVERICANRISNYLAYPDHFMINNHQGFGMEYFRLMLLIEGEKGYNERLFQASVKKARAMLNWYLDDDGMCYESIKGWLNISAFMAAGLRERDFLKHSHLRAKMRFFQAALRWEDGHWNIRDEMRASAFHVIWMMRYFHPANPGLDMLYQASLASSPFLTDSEARWPNPVGVAPELLLLWAEEVLQDKDGKPLDWTDQKRVDSLKLPVTWKDDTRGYVMARNSWRKDDLQVGFCCKQDFYYGGHEGSENNRLLLWHGGMNWVRDVNMLATKATFLQNMLSIDGKGLQWPPAPGVWLGVRETSAGLTASGDGKMGYTHSKSMQVHPLDFPSAQLPYYAPFAEGNYDLTRDLQVAFHPGTVKFNDGYAHTDYGPWSGETRLVENYRLWNPVECAYRTVHLARGENPYVLVIDDAKKDNQPHLFEWNITLPDDAELIDAKTPEIVFQSVDPSALREDDLLLGKAGTPRDPKSGKLLPKKGDPLCLVRVLWRNSNYGFPAPRFEKYQGFTHLSIPAISVSPDFRVLLYPHYQGDPLPQTTWNAARTELTVEIKGVKDVYRFGQADGGRTVFAMERGGKPALDSGAAPARPLLKMRGRRFDINDQRTTRDENKPAEYLFDKSIEAVFVRPNPPACIRYTTDGSEPNEKSPLYEAPVSLTKTSEIKARVFDPQWPCATKQSATLLTKFTRRAAAPALPEPPAGAQPGLLVRVYEKKTVLWNDKGFFDAKRVMAPNLDRETPIFAAPGNGFTLPAASPQHPVREQCKGFYRFTGWFKAPERGTYEFAVDSCGPVTLNIGGQDAIASTGVFHQQQTVRRGEAVLEAGWQPIDLVVCDPLFWNLNTAGVMPFSVTARRDDAEARPVSSEQLRALPPATSSATSSAATSPAWHEALTKTPLLEPGVELRVFDREKRRMEADFLDIDGLEPDKIQAVDAIESNPSLSLVRSHDGYFKAPSEGVYVFNMPARRAENAFLNEPRAAYQSQIRVDNEVVIQRGVAGRYPDGKIALKAGWHAISIRFGASLAPGSVTYPDGQPLPLTAALLRRPALVGILPRGATAARKQVEIYSPTPVTLHLPGVPDAQIRYTLDGAVPTESSALYKTPLDIDKTLVVTACAFDKGEALTAPARLNVTRVNVPEADLLGDAAFGKWNGAPGAVDLGGNINVWIAPDSSLAEGRSGKVLATHRTQENSGKPQEGKNDVNVQRPSSKAAFKITGIKMREVALSVSVWFNSETGGKLFGKDGYNAFGKSYKTVSCAVENSGRISAGPGRVTGGKIAFKTWQHLVLTADEKEIALYLNGEKTASAPGSRDLTTDSLDFFTDHAALVEDVRLYNRVISPEDVKHLFERTLPKEK